MSPDGSALAAAVSGLVRSDPHGPGITRARSGDGFRYLDPPGAGITDEETLQRIRALRIPPAWENVWISPDPLGHIQTTIVTLLASCGDGIVSAGSSGQALPLGPSRGLCCRKTKDGHPEKNRPAGQERGSRDAVVSGLHQCRRAGAQADRRLSPG